jgi:hypothetical protein
MKHLSKEEFSATMQGNMTNVTNKPETSVDIWPQVKLLVDRGIVDDAVYTAKKVQVVYRNGAGTFDHVTLPTNDPDHFIVIVVDILNNKITGYYQLDLTEEDGYNF